MSDWLLELAAASTSAIFSPSSISDAVHWNLVEDHGWTVAGLACVSLVSPLRRPSWTTTNLKNSEGVPG